MMTRKEFRAWIRLHCPRLGRKELRQLYSAPDMEACQKQVLLDIEERRVERETKNKKPPAPVEKLTPVQELFGMMDILTDSVRLPYSPVMEQLKEEIKEGLKIVR